MIYRIAQDSEKESVGSSFTDGINDQSDRIQTTINERCKGNHNYYTCPLIVHYTNTAVKREFDYPSAYDVLLSSSLLCIRNNKYSMHLTTLEYPSSLFSIEKTIQTVGENIISYFNL